MYSYLFVLLGGVEIQLYRLFRPLDEFIQALRLSMASGVGGKGGDLVAVLVRSTMTLNLAFHLSTNLR